jgi:hypothetical protein
MQRPPEPGPGCRGGGAARLTNERPGRGAPRARPERSLATTSSRHAKLSPAHNHSPRGNGDLARPHWLTRRTYGRPVDRSEQPAADDARAPACRRRRPLPRVGRVRRCRPSSSLSFLVKRRDRRSANARAVPAARPRWREGDTRFAAEGARGPAWQGRAGPRDRPARAARRSWRSAATCAGPAGRRVRSVLFRSGEIFPRRDASSPAGLDLCRQIGDRFRGKCGGGAHGQTRC